MAPFVPRQRKHKVRQRLKSKTREGPGDDPNVLELQSSIIQKDEKKRAIENASRAEKPKMSSRKQKRLHNYIVGIYALLWYASLNLLGQKIEEGRDRRAY